jgi:hypothetical protein
METKSLWELIENNIIMNRLENELEFEWEPTQEPILSYNWK